MWMIILSCRKRSGWLEFKKQILELANTEQDIRILNKKLIEYIVVTDEETENEMKELVIHILILCRQFGSPLDAVSSALALAIYMSHNPDSPMCLIEGLKVPNIPKVH